MSNVVRIFTTGEVACAFKVPSRTVRQWFDAGQLQGYRIPGSAKVKFTREQVVKFAEAHGIPLDGLDAEEDPR